MALILVFFFPVFFLFAARLGGPAFLRWKLSVITARPAPHPKKKKKIRAGEGGAQKEEGELAEEEEDSDKI